MFMRTDVKKSGGLKVWSTSNGSLICFRKLKNDLFQSFGPEMTNIPYALERAFAMVVDREFVMKMLERREQRRLQVFPGSHRFASATARDVDAYLFDAS